MSNSALNWAYKLRCGSGPAKSVLAYLANCANPRFGESCFPSIATICEDLEINDATARKALRHLVDQGIMTIEERAAPNGRRMSNRYLLAVNATVRPPPETASPEPQWQPSWTSPPTPPILGGSPNSTPLDLGGSPEPTPPILGGSHPPISPDSEGGDPPNFGRGTPLILGGNPKREPLEERKEESLFPIPESVAAHGAALTRVRKMVIVSPGEFEAWWQAYPHKDGKLAARTAYAKARQTATADELLRGLQRYPFRDERRFQPHPATWLNRGSWLSDSEPEFDPALRAAGITPEMLARSAHPEAPDSEMRHLRAIAGGRL